LLLGAARRSGRRLRGTSAGTPSTAPASNQHYGGVLLNRDGVSGVRDTAAKGEVRECGEPDRVQGESDVYGNAAPSNQPPRSHGQLITRRGIVPARYTLGRCIARGG